MANECDLKEMERLAVMKAKELPLDQWTFYHDGYSYKGKAPGGFRFDRVGYLFCGSEIVCYLPREIPAVWSAYEAIETSRRCEAIRKQLIPPTEKPSTEPKKGFWARLFAPGTPERNGNDGGPR